jgi:hypothetical protein
MNRFEKWLVKHGYVPAKMRANGQIVPLVAPNGNVKGYRMPPGDNTLGWRAWEWDDRAHALRSPAQGNLWTEPELRCDKWEQDDAVRGRGGIHALWPVPKGWQDKDSKWFAPDPTTVVGIVERFGHYVLGEDGWRAEWVVIKELAAEASIIEAVRKAYPDITVHLRAPIYYDAVTAPLRVSTSAMQNVSLPAMNRLSWGSQGLQNMTPEQQQAFQQQYLAALNSYTNFPQGYGQMQQSSLAAPWNGHLWPPNYP